MIIAPDNQRTRVRIQNYSDLNPVALRRILTDPNSPSNAMLNQTYATLLLYFDPEIQLFRLPETLLAPPKVSKEPSKSRIWNDFTFQEIGKGDDFLNTESIIEKGPGSPQAMASGIAPPHPYLSVEKATRVNQWVIERAEMENEAEPEPEPEPETSIAPQPDPPREESPVAPAMKKPPGIRTRKAATAAKPQPVSTTEPVKAPSPKNASTPRKRWIMQYGPGSEDRLTTFPENTKSESANQSPSDSLLLDKSPDSSNGASTTRPQTPDSKLRASVNFDPTKYGLAKTPQHAAKNSLGSPTTPGNNGENQQLMTPRRRSGNNELVDVFAPVTQDSAVSHPQMSFDQPALIPQKPNEAAENVPGQGMSLMSTGKSSDDLLGLNFEGETTASGFSKAMQLAMAQVDSNGDYLPWQEKRLRDLKRSLRERKKGTSDLEESVPQAFGPPDRRQISMLLARQKLAELEKNLETVKKTTEETSTREFYHTMNHKTAGPSEKAKSKAEVKAKRQATLEDAWGIVKKPAKKAESSTNKEAEGVDGNTKKERMAEPSEPKKDPQNPQQLLEEMEAHQKHTESLFDSLKSALEAAEFFTGPLTLEAQFGLILIPLLPKTYNENLLSLDEWTRIFQPRNGLAPLTTKFINRLTTAGSDVDHIVDLKTSKAEGNRHLFEQEYTEYNVSYEFHCRTTADQPFVIAIDEQGRHVIRKPSKTLGAVNLHFPKQTWDASIVLGGIIEHIMGSDPELEEAVQYLVDNLWVQPDKSLVRILSRLPKDNKFVIERVLMKRWTRHRHIRPVDTVPAKKVPSDNPNPSSPSDSQDQVLVLATTENENNDIFLQVLEVQDLLIGSSTSDSQALRARCAPIPEMLKKDRLWYEVSLVSPAIEAILKANAGVEIGERTEDWRSTDLLGKDALLFSDDIGHDIPLLSPVATAIGAAGLGELFTLTKIVVEKIDGIGFWNYGPGVEAVRVAAATAAAAGASIVAPLSLPIGMDRPTSSALVRTEQQNKVMGFDDPDSIKEVESVLAKTAVPAVSGAGGATAVAPGLERTSSAATSSARVMGQGIDELDYW